MEKPYRIFAAGIGWFALALQYWLIVRLKTDGDLVAGAVRFFSYFTILSNILVALAMTLPWAAPRSRLGRFSLEPSVRTAILVYIVVVAVIYHLLLRHLWNPQGWQLVADGLLHVAAPAMYVVDWFLFVPKGTVPFRSAFAWLGFPVLYAGYSLAHGAATGFYPYPFIDVSRLGLERTLIDMGMLLFLFGGLGLFAIALDRLLARMRAKD